MKENLDLSQILRGNLIKEGCKEKTGGEKSAGKYKSGNEKQNNVSMESQAEENPEEIADEECEGEIIAPIDTITELWEYLSMTEKPVVMYGMGSGAEKIMAQLEKRGVRPAAFMASDDFVRGHSFLGYEVKKLSDIEKMYEDFIILLCFGSALPEVMRNIDRIAETYELYAPDVPVIGDGVFDKQFVRDNMEKLEWTRNCLEDEQSQFVFDKIAQYRITGDIRCLNECSTPKDEALRLLKTGSNETYVDLGAYTGDTVVEFLKLCNMKFNRIYAVEPDRHNYEKMRRNIYMFSGEKFRCYNAVAWSSETELDFFHRSGRNSSVRGKGRMIKMPAKTVDGILEGKEATLIKYDVEGCEKEALLGCTKTIAKYKPKLIVSVYHRNEDIIELPALIKQLNPKYRIYMRHHPYYPAWDTNLYCI